MVGAAPWAADGSPNHAGGRQGRRAFIVRTARLGAAAAGLLLLDGCGLLPSSAQTARVARVGVLAFDDGTGPRWDAFRRGLREHGWVEGQNLSLVWRLAEGRDERLPALTSELIGVPVDVLVASGTQAAVAARQATSTIPIVMPAVNDPIGSGLVDSFARPGGNATGSALLSPEVAPKWVEILKETLPRLERMAVLASPANPSHGPLVEATHTAASRLGLQAQVYEVRSADELESVVKTAASWPADGLVVLPDLLFFTQRARLAEVLAGNQLPAIYPARDYADAGGLMAYGADVVDLFRRAAGYVDRILRGARPSDLPIEQPSSFELVVNQKALQALGLTVPAGVAPLVTEQIQ